MKIDRAGVPFVVGAAAPGLVLSLLGLHAAGVLLLLLAACLALFFRDPERQLPADIGRDAVLAPADGRVVHAGDPEAGVAPDGEWRQVSIFLSLLDVHVNRSPIGGRVVAVTQRRGRFLPAFDRRSAADNERTEVRVDHDGQRVVFRQVVGVLARRIVCRLEPGMDVAQGQRVGVMKFGSRMDVFVPPSASVEVTVGQAVRGGETIVAHLVAESWRCAEEGRGE